MESGEPSIRRKKSHPNKTERKFIEKNRRNNMKALFTNLSSLLPNQNSQGPLSLPAQIHVAVNYIKSLQMKVEKCSSHKEKLLSRKRLNSSSCGTSCDCFFQIEIHKVGGPALNQLLITGLDDPTIFYRMICLLHERGAEVVYANFSLKGNSVVQFVHHKIEELKLTTLSAATVWKKLKELTDDYLSSTREEESELQAWDLEIVPDTWDFEIVSDTWDIKISEPKQLKYSN
uniref:Transcription factor bHLH55 n=1 Tax=Nothapodytes nimmoniana TaxID=159386 RepID=A0A9E9BYY7_NOTNI|nr:transcription factor bHLH55 [Nothapodytes nimmoniana]